MNDYILNIRLNGSYYCAISLKADNRQEAIEQSNEIMNRFPEPEYKAEVVEVSKTSKASFAWFN